MDTATYKNSLATIRRVFRYSIVTFLVGFCVFVLISLYLSSIRTSHDKEISLIVTIYLAGGVYAGMYLSQIWIAKNGSTPRHFIRLLLWVMTLCLVIVFFTAQFPNNTRNVFAAFLFFLLPMFVFSVSTGILIRSVRARIHGQLNEAKVSAAQSRSELQFLQSQLSPHFLFNTLNNIYGISLNEHQKVPDLLLKLSSLLRYSVYDAGELLVPLKDELNYIRDYIQFEQLRIGDKLRMTISMEEPKNSSIRIAPLLLIVFIENAFKHSKTTGNQPVFIDINLQFWNNRILFGIKNSCITGTNEPSIVNRQSGFGLDNVKKRLDLLYKNEHYLEITESDGWYQVVLQLKIK
ncbi:MAG: histidine kinase [Bacteroidota bacterium]